MNQAHFHLVVNHLPIIFPIIGLLVLAIGIGFRSEIVKRTAYFIFTLGAISTVIAMNSGEGAEEIVEELPGVTHNIIHEHEEVAEFYALLSYLFGAISLFTLWANWKRKRFSNALSYLVLVFSIVVIIFGKQTGTTGGEIRHTEIRENKGSVGINDEISEEEEHENEQEEE